MQSLFLLLAALACPIGMGAMMWMMMRGTSRRSTEDSAEAAAGQASPPSTI